MQVMQEAGVMENCLLLHLLVANEHATWVAFSTSAIVDTYVSWVVMHVRIPVINLTT